MKITIIGAGASGLSAAIAAASEGASVTVLESNDRPGRKILATGNGRCNLTNQSLGTEWYHTDNPAFVARILKRFGEKEIRNFFADLGVATYDIGGWVYPTSDQASSVLNALLLEAERLHVKIKTRERAAAVIPPKEPGDLWTVRTEGWQYSSDAVILSCGSPASDIAGASDFALRTAGDLGISTQPFRPALTGLRCRGEHFALWKGCRVRARVTLSTGRGERAENHFAEGEVQLTEYGLSGIPVFTLSHDAVLAAEAGLRPHIRLDASKMARGQMESLIDGIQARDPGRNAAQILGGIFPDRYIRLILDGLNEQQKQIALHPGTAGKAARDDFWAAVKRRIAGLELEVTGASGMKHAQVCSGGIRTEELTDDLESRKYPGFFVTGEAVNCDGDCGGRNLSFCWSSGQIAGKAAAHCDRICV